MSNVARQIAGDYYRTTLTAAEKRSRPPLTGSPEVDVCIVGAGLAGLNLALSLAERGKRV